MTDPKSELKSLAKEVRASISWLDLSHGHTIEILVSLLTEEKDWNHCSANTQLTIPDNLSEVFRVVSKTQRRWAELEDAPDRSSSGRSQRWEMVMAIVSFIQCGEPYSDLMIARMLDACTLPNYSTPMTINSEGEMVPLSVEEYPESIIFNLGSWFFSLDEYTYGNYPWDHTKKIALNMGFTANQASLIRDIQREAPNHNWPIDLWFEVGVLDADQEAFLEQLSLDSDWEEHFEKLLHHDGHYN